MMAAIIIRMHESKTPGEDFALEERKGRFGNTTRSWRILQNHFTIAITRTIQYQS